MNCEKYQELISCLLDGEISPEEKIELENHIASCPQCRAMYEDFVALSGMMGESMADVPDSLHEKIMSGVRSAKKVKKPAIIRLRPYMAAAACFVVVIGAVFALRGGVKLDMMSNKSASAAPEAAADRAAPADKPASGYDSYGYSGSTGAADDSLDKATSEDAAEVPMEMAPDEPADEPAAEPEAPMANETDRGENFNSPIFSYQDILARSIDSASLSTLMSDGSTKTVYISDLEALSKALEPMDFYEDTDFNISAILELVCGDEIFTLELYYAGDALIVRCGGECWFANDSVQEFLSIK